MQPNNDELRGKSASENRVTSDELHAIQAAPPPRASPRTALWSGAAIACALVLFAVSRAIKPKSEPFSFNAATPATTRAVANPANKGTAPNATREYSRRAFSTPKVIAPASNLIVVHVAGEVKKPGIYKMPSDARIYQAIARAGGAKNSADLNAINLAARAQDGSRIDIPSKNAPREYSQVEAKAAPRESVSARENVTREKSPRTTSSVSGREKSAAPRTASTRSAETAAKLRANPVNLNSATAQELEMLPGIGPAMSSRILEFRAENGAFSSVEELDEVRGIGPKKLEKLRPLVRVN